MPCICNAYYEWADAMPRDTIARRGGGREREGEAARQGDAMRWTDSGMRCSCLAHVMSRLPAAATLLPT